MRKHFCDLCQAEMQGGLCGGGSTGVGQEMGLYISAQIENPRNEKSPSEVCNHCIAKALRRAAEKLDA